MTEEGYAALRQGCALVERVWVGRLELLGPDRQRFLNAYVTCDVKELARGAGAYGFFTNKQGRIQADAVVLALEDRFRLELPQGRAPVVAEQLRKYVLADRVEVMPAKELLPLTLAGPRAEELLAGAGAPALPAATWSHARAAILGTEVTLVRQGRMGAPAYTLWVSGSVAPALTADLTARGAVPASFADLEAVRVEAGIPRFGADFGPDHFPQETGIEEAVSYTKGCYLGQEVVARIHYRGGVQRQLVGLE
ncbi:MAG: YgfZ/GcvT domain-containing protein, partial [Thermoanaerobaculia bacterium]